MDGTHDFSGVDGIQAFSGDPEFSAESSEFMG
jgi:hypothetical protein